MSHTEACLRRLGGCAPRHTGVSWLAPVTARKPPADSAVLDEGNGPVSIWRDTVFSSLRLEERLTGVFIALVAPAIASFALRSSLPTNSNCPSTTICGV